MTTTRRPETSGAPSGDPRPPVQVPVRDSRSQVRLRAISATTLAKANWWVRVARAAGAAARQGGRAPGGITWPYAIELLRDGFLPHAGRYYDFERHGRRAYLSDREHLLTWAIDWPFAGIIDDDLAFYFTMRRIQAPTPEVLGVIREGTALALSGERGEDWVGRELERRGSLVVTPSPRGGEGRAQIWRAEEGTFSIDRRPLPWHELGRATAALHDSVICEHIEPAPYAQGIWPAANTIRIITMVPADGTPLIGACAHRFGRAPGGAADGFAGGVLHAPLDPETGTLGRAFGIDAGGAPRWTDHHPDSGAPIRGVDVPRWAEIRGGILEAAGRLPFLPYVGWDVLPTADGFRIIEADTCPATDVMQVATPMLEREGVREFFLEHGVLAGGRTLDPTPVHIPLRGVSTHAVGRLRWRKKQLWMAKRMVRPKPKSFPQGRRTALRLARRGFVPGSGPLYASDAGGRHDYVTDRQREMTWTINWPWAGLLDDKVAFSAMLADLGAPTPEVLAVIRAGRVLGLGDPTRSREWLRLRLEDGARVVVRPTRGGSGMGVRVLDGSSGRLHVNGRPSTWGEEARVIDGLDDCVITDFVQQARYSQLIFPTPNTIRVLTMIDVTSGDPFIAIAVHRFGGARSGAVDNWSQGGIAATVDIETGILESAVSGHDGRLRWQSHHPDSGALIEGTPVAGWAHVREGILALARRAAFVPYVGWDVLVTDDGYQVIEGNKFSDVQMQIHKPLLADERARLFYRRYGIL